MNFLFRLQSRPRTGPENGLLQSIHTLADELNLLLQQMPPGRERSLAVTKLQEVVMWVREGMVPVEAEGPKMTLRRGESESPWSVQYSHRTMFDQLGR